MVNQWWSVMETAIKSRPAGGTSIDNQFTYIFKDTDCATLDVRAGWNCVWRWQWLSADTPSAPTVGARCSWHGNISVPWLQLNLMGCCSIFIRICVDPSSGSLTTNTDAERRKSLSIAIDPPNSYFVGWNPEGARYTKVVQKQCCRLYTSRIITSKSEYKHRVNPEIREIQWQQSFVMIVL